MAVAEPEVIKPQPGPQENFLRCNADIAGIGGAAGGSKTFSLLMDPLRFINVKGFGGVIFRRTNADIRKEGGLFDSARDLYSKVGAVAREHVLDFTFPGGASISLDGLQYESDVYNYQGAQICYMAFDEATHFLANQFWYLFSRNRSVCSVRPYIRLAFNPDPDSFVFELFGPWVNEEHEFFPAEAGQILHFTRDEDGNLHWSYEPVFSGGNPEPISKSISYFPATIYDNKILMEKDPGYLASLNMLSGVDKRRLLYGEWKTFEKSGALWKRAMFARPGFRLPECLVPVPEVRDDTGRILKPANAKFVMPAGVVRVVVAIDPSVSDPEKIKNPHKKPDECGLVIAGVTASKEGVVLGDYSRIMSPAEWAKRAVKAYRVFHANSIVAEANQGGELVREVIKNLDDTIPIQLVHASSGKRARAEPVSFLYERERVKHAGRLDALESEMCNWDASNPAAKSPNRVEAATWAFHALGLCNVTGTKIHDRMLNR